MSTREPPARFQRWYGRDEAPVRPITVRAGNVTALLDGLDLRYMRIGSVEIVRRIYVAVRDEVWDTCPGVCTSIHRDIGADRFTIAFAVIHAQGPIEYAWQGRIEGTPDGVITYRMDGRTGASFRYNRIGFCVLHPPRASAGQPYRGHGPAGEVRGELPRLIAPQRIENGVEMALFPPVAHLDHDVPGGGLVSFDFEGDLFEMEDQRNWTDDSFKTYCTPLALRWPHTATAGQIFKQRVTIRASGINTGEVEGSAAGPRLTLGQPLGRTLPPLGFGLADHDGPMSRAEIEKLRRLRPAHLRVDLKLGDSAYPRRLAEAIGAAALLDCALEIAVIISDDHLAELHALARLLGPELMIARVLVLHEREMATGEAWVRRAREALGPHLPGVPFAGGSNVYFTELNAARPAVDGLDAVVYPISPQIHAFDERSLVETLAAQAETVRTAQALFSYLPVIVSPIALKPRFNPDKPEPEPLVHGMLPANVDARQMSLFGAAWTLGSLKALAEAGASSITYYETTGPRGVVETDAGTPVTMPFPSTPGMCFPLYHIFAALAERHDAALIGCTADDPLSVVGLALDAGNATHVLVANLTAAPIEARIGPCAGRASIIWRLDDRFAGENDLPMDGTDLPIMNGEAMLRLGPFTMAGIDLTELLQEKAR